MTSASARGRRAKQVGDEFERKFISDFHDETGKKLSRQLKERRDGNLGDIEVHPDVPMVFQCRKRKKLSVWSALDDALEAAVWWGKEQSHYPVGILERRLGSAAPRNDRAVIQREDDWRDLLETFQADGGAPNIIMVTKSGAKYPRVWDGLQEATELVERHGSSATTAVCLGIRTDPELENVVLVEYHGWLHIVGELFRRRLW